jgi:PAS domain S-box-containing protein
MNVPQAYDQPEPDHSDQSVSALLRALAQAEQRLRELEARFEAQDDDCSNDELTAQAMLHTTLLNNLQDCVLIVDEQGNVVHVAGNTVGLLGYAPSELIVSEYAVNLLQLVDPRDQQQMAQALREVCERPRRAMHPARVIDRAGEGRWIEFSFVPLYGEAGDALTGLQIILRDISDRVQAENMMRSLNEAAQIVQTASLSLDDVIETVSAQLWALGFFSAIGLLPSGGEEVRWVKFRADERRLQALEELGASVMEMAPAEIPALAQALETGRPVQSVLDETQLQLLLGDSLLARQALQLIGPLWVMVAPLRADGRPLGFLVVASLAPRPESVLAIEAFANQTAISLRNAQLVDRIAEREAQYRAIFEAARDGLLVLDGQGKITAASVAACELFGYPTCEIIGLSLDSLLAEEQERVGAWLRQASDEPSRQTLQAAAIRRCGNRFPVEMRGSRLGHGAAAQTLVLITDITERMRAQEALIQAERLGALGQMAGGIAHDFNNTLVSVLGHTQMAITDLTEHPEVLGDHLAKIELGARQAAEAVSRLQTLYRESDDKSDFVPMELAQVLEEVLALNRPRWRDMPQMRGVTIHLETAFARAAPVRGNTGELRRVLSNLVINAIEAMPEGGVLRCETSADETWSEVRISDSGAGIESEDLARIFEPFYTTKKSSGLGLTISRNIIERHGGTIEVESETGVGTTFVVRLPRHVGELPVAAPRVAVAAPECASDSLSVLVVDDEPGVRGVLQRLLERYGHRVQTAESGQMGITMLEQRSYDLLICDLGMPDVQGSQVMQFAHGLYPGMPIVLTTGWGDSITPEQLRSMHAMTLLSKPFGQQDVQRVLAEALAARQGGG